MHIMDAILISVQGSGYKGVSETEEVSDTFFLCDRNFLHIKRSARMRWNHPHSRRGLVWSR